MKEEMHTNGELLASWATREMYKGRIASPCSEGQFGDL